MTEVLAHPTDAAVHQLAKWLSNALRNPLAPIRSILHLLRRKHPSEAELERWLEILERQSTQLVNLADDLLTIANLARGQQCAQPQESDLVALLSRALEGCLPADPIRLAQVLKILIRHVARQAPAGDVISLTLTLLGGEMEILVCDTATGIMRELRELVPEGVYSPFGSTGELLIRLPVSQAAQPAHLT
jgi:signal transduction histidine kinase